MAQNHLRLNKRLDKEINELTKRFHTKGYAKIENLEKFLLRKDISVEKKKKFLIRELHNTITKTFSINSKVYNNKSIESLKRNLADLRNITSKLRSINYYLETTFLGELKLLKFKQSQGPRVKEQYDLARDELEILEYTAYKLIEKAAILDKRLLSEYKHKAKTVLMKESAEAKGLDQILRKESILLEHLEAKLPPPKIVNAALTKEPAFTHWVSRIFALLLHFEWLYKQESLIFSKLKKNKLIKAKINRKISHLINERSKLVRILQEKAASVRKLRLNNNLKQELHNFTTTINL